MLVCNLFLNRELAVSLTLFEQLNAVNFVDLIKQYTDIDELSQALLNTLIDRIEVHEPEDVDGELIQKLDVYYKFVGRLD